MTHRALPLLLALSLASCGPLAPDAGTRRAASSFITTAPTTVATTCPPLVRQLIVTEHAGELRIHAVLAPSDAGQDTRLRGDGSMGWELSIWLDTDQNPATGASPYGSEAVLSTGGINPPDRLFYTVIGNTIATVPFHASERTFDIVLSSYLLDDPDGQLAWHVVLQGAGCDRVFSGTTGTQAEDVRRP